MKIDLDNRKKGYLDVYVEKLYFNSAADKNTYYRFKFLRHLVIFSLFIVPPMIIIAFFALQLGLMKYWGILFAGVTVLYLLIIFLTIGTVKINYLISERDIYYIAKKGWQKYAFADIIKIKKNAKFGTLVVKTKQKKIKKSRYFLGSHVEDFAALLSSGGDLKQFNPIMTLEEEKATATIAKTATTPQKNENIAPVAEVFAAEPVISSGIADDKSKQKIDEFNSDFLDSSDLDI